MPEYPLCLPCISEWVANGSPGGVDGEEASKLSPAVTLAPAWETKTTMGQMMMACVMVPTCFRHLGVKQKSAAEKAMESGLFLGGQSPQ
jgi:hypothetical protein